MNIRQMIAYVQVYIFLRKNIEGDIALPRTHREIIQLTQAYEIAIEWMQINNCKLTLIL